MTYVFGNVANWFSGGNKEIDTTTTPLKLNEEMEGGSKLSEAEIVQKPEEVKGEKTAEDEGGVRQNADESVVSGDVGGKGHSLEKDLEEVSHLAYNTAKDIGSYIFSLGKTYSQQVAKTAKQLKDTIEEKTLIGEFSKEQEKFLTVNKEKKKMADAAVPPWVGYNEEEVMKTQILELSKDKRNVLRNPPSGIQFHFDFENSYPVALVMLEEDDRLKNLRFELVPKQIKEDVFWRNYFYRVSLIKQSTQLTSLTSDTIPVNKDDNHHHQLPPPTSSSSSSTQQHDDMHSVADEKDGMKISESEFVSDAFLATNVNDPELASAMQQLTTTTTTTKNNTDTHGGDVIKSPSNTSAEVADWEKELQAELQEYEVISDEISDAALEREIMNQLEEETKPNK